MPEKTILAAIFMALLIGCASTRTEVATVVQEPPADSVQALESDIVDSTQITPDAQEIMDNAKIQYSNALICLYDNDTTGARYHFEETLDILRRLQDFDSLEPWAEDESILFTQKVTEDYIHYVKSPDSLDSEHKPTSLQEQISLLEPVEEVEWENGKFTVLDDRDGHVPIILNAQVDRIINFLQNQRHNEFQIWLNRINRYEGLFKDILAQYNLPPELFYMALIESGLNPRAYSYAHAAGPWQFIIGTAKKFGLTRTWWIDERYDPVKATHAAAKYLSALYDEFEDWYLVMAAYNGGERRIWRAIRREGTRDFWSLRTLPRQTRNYVPTVLAAAIIANHPEKYGFTITPSPVWNPDTVHIHKSYDLHKVADAMKVNVEKLRELNPELRPNYGLITPPDTKDYVLRLPPGSTQKFLAVADKIPDPGKPEIIYHRVRYGETLSSIAGRYRIPMSSIIRMNNIRNSHWIRVGQRLSIPVGGNYAATTTRSTRTSSVPSSVSGRKKIDYIVKKGDTLGEIAEMYNTLARRIREWNGLRYGQYIFPGDHLAIWVPEDSEFLGSGGADNSSQNLASSGANDSEGVQVYVVRWGDTLWDIAQRYGVDVNSLKQWNADVASGDIKPGDRIKIILN